MKRIFLAIILLSIVHVATAQNHRKYRLVQRIKQEMADKNRIQMDRLPQASFNNRIHSKDTISGLNHLGSRNISRIQLTSLTTFTDVWEKSAEMEWSMYSLSPFFDYGTVDNFSKGKKLFQAGYYHGASYYLHQELKRSPQNGRVLYYLARINNSYIDQALANIPESDKGYYYKALLLKGIYSLEEKDTNTAMAYFNDIFSLNNISDYVGLYMLGWKCDIEDANDMRDVYITARFNRACVFLSRRDTSNAINELDEVIRRGLGIEPITQKAWLLRMELNYELNNYQFIPADYISLSEYSPNLLHNATSQIIMTEAELNMDSVERACSYLDSAMKYNRDTAWMYLLYWTQHDSEHGIPLFHAYADKIADKKTIDQDELNLSLSSFCSREKYENLVQLFEKQKYRYFNYAPLYFCASVGYVGTGELEKAIEAYEEFKKNFILDENTFGDKYLFIIDNDIVASMNNCIQYSQAILFLESADFDKAIEIINSLPDSILDKDICLPIGIFINAKNGDYDIALRQSNRLVEIDPSADSYTLRGWIYYKRGQMDLAKADFQRVLDLESDSVTWNTAEAYYCLGKTRNAKRTARKLLSADSLFFEDYWWASLFYETVGNEKKAITYIKKALSIATEEDRNLYPWIIWSYETPSMAEKIAKIINQK